MSIPPSLMGEAGVQNWDAEFRRTGHVVFRPRRRALLSRRVVLSWLVALVPLIGTIEDLGSRGTWFYIRAAAIVLLLAAALTTTTRILRGHPLLRIDTDGIRLGKNFVPWSSIATIGAPVNSFWSDHVPIHLITEDAADLDIPRDLVDDLPALATWLTTLHTERP
ncbi:hypothetical protein ACI2LF_24670 [Kribbella sp. NPDC020789]